MKRHAAEKITQNISCFSKIYELAKKGYIKLATGKKVEIKVPPKIPGKPWSEILEEIRK